MTKVQKTTVEERLHGILEKLSNEERAIFTAVFRIEREKLFLKQPSVKEDILSEIRKVIK